MIIRFGQAVMNSRSPSIRRGSAFIEMLAVLGIIVMLAALLIPMFIHARAQSAQARCMNNLRQIGSAFASYATENKGHFPSTRPSTGSNVTPDISNSGFAAIEPFGPDGPVHNNVPAAAFLLLRAQDLSPSTFICPATTDPPDNLGDVPARQRSNFTNVRRNLSYGIQNPYASSAAVAAGFKWNNTLPAGFPLMADRGPDSPTDSSADVTRLANSLNHEGRGQNVLYADGGVQWRLTPLAGLNDDHIYLTRGGRVLDSPGDASDSILLPTDR
jgi:type II secretory pathway pseudopilin PulG